MKGKGRLALVLAVALALCLALVGCGKADNTKAFAGYWKLTAMTEDGESVSQDDLKLMESFGMSVSLTINEDKTYTFDLFGDKVSGSWEPKSATEATFTMEGEKVTGKLSGDTLTLTQGSSELKFQKGEAPASTASTASTAATSTAATSTASSGGSTEQVIPIGQIIADDDYCIIEVLDKKVDWADDPGFTVKVANKSDKEFYITDKYDSFSVNGKMCSPYIYETIKPGKYAETFMWFDGSDVANLDELVDVEGVLEIIDTGSYDTLAEYEFNM